MNHFNADVPKISSLIEKNCQLDISLENEGSYKLFEHETSNGSSISLYDVFFEKQFSDRRVTSPMLQVCVMMEGSGVSYLEGCSAPITYLPGHMFLFFSTRSLEATHSSPAMMPMKLVELRFDVGYGNNIFPDILGALKKDAFLFCDDSDEGVWLARFPTPTSIRCIVNEMHSKQIETASDRFWLEAKSVEILSTITEMLEKQADLNRQAPVELTRRERKAIHQVYDLLLSSLETEWTIHELARKVGINDNKLKRGFKSIFGTSVYACLQQHRMTKAAEALRHSQESITMIALDVGYSSPAHFAKIFKRYFGMTPRAYRAHN